MRQSIQSIAGKFTLTFSRNELLNKYFMINLIYHKTIFSEEKMLFNKIKDFIKTV
jgi:hypothetical protein